ncbi:MAG TPA: hypothetical protein VK559_09610 [Ferruginibacter sp.]|nr:hypothetical protein [Ferruginibacter sp.]
MKIRIFVILILVCFFCNQFAIAQAKTEKNFIDPTGTYKLSNKTTIKDGYRYGNFGGIEVKLLTNSTIAISLFICRGATNYNSGSFIDTLTYQNSKAIYKTPEEDSSCSITFTFTNKGVIVDQYQADINFGCNFGQGVFADGFYKRISIKTPLIVDLEGKYFGANGILLKDKLR